MCLDDSNKLGFLVFRLETRARVRARVRSWLGFKVVIICRYALEFFLADDCINNLQN